MCRYADGGDSYWTGYFTSRPALKGYIRSLSGYYLVRKRIMLIYDYTFSLCLSNKVFLSIFSFIPISYLLL